MNLPALIAPSDIDRFACTGCGRCCRLWGVAIDGDAFSRAAAFLENPPAPRPNPEIPWYTEENGVKYYQLTQAGSCVFLDSDKYCYLHKHDPALKSVICREYPREPMITARGQEISMTFSSYGAFKNVLLNPAPFEIVSLPAPKNFPVPAAADYAVREPKPISWKTYFLIEAALLDRLGATASPDDALVESAHFLSALENEDDGKKLRKRLRAGDILPASFSSRPAISDLESAFRLMEKILEFRARYLAGMPLMTVPRQEIEEMVEKMRRGPEEEKIGSGLFYRRLQRKYWNPLKAEYEPIFRKWIQYKIFQKRFFIEYGFVRGFNILCFMYAILRLHVMLQAREKGNPLSVEDLFDSFNFVEVNFAHSGKFLLFWKEFFTSDLSASSSLTEILIRQ